MKNKSLRLACAIALTAIYATANAGTLVLESQKSWGDSDYDGVVDILDNAIYVPNPTQYDTDGDGLGDAADPHPAVQDSLIGAPVIFFSPLFTNAGSQLSVTVNISTPNPTQLGYGGWLSLDFGNNGIWDAEYFDTFSAGTATFQISPSFFAGPGWDLNNPGLYTLRAQIHLPPFGTTTASTANTVLVNPTAPVPEPETYAMMLAGLGLLSGAVKRRNARQQ